MLRSIVALALAAVGAATLHAQAAPAASAPPSTDIYLAPLAVRGARVTVGKPANVTRRPGYDNQPSFTPDGRAILFTSVRGDAQADIWRYDLRTRATTRVTATPESEYSPTVTPGGARFSAVRVERDSTQRLWTFALDGGFPELLLERVKPVGYHLWLDRHTLALFVLGAPSTLQIADLWRGDAQVVAQDVGRSLQLVPGGHAFSFLQRNVEKADTVWRLAVLDLDLSRDGHWVVAKVARMLPGSDYVVWLSRTRVLAAQGSRLFVLDVGGPAEWRPVADLAANGLRRISRLAVSPDGRWLALVAEDR